MIGRYRAYLGYVLRHKRYVFQAARELGIPLRGLLHDLSKFRPSELLPYARYFYEPDGSPLTRRDETGYYQAARSGDDAFDVAWMLHQHRNPHHWQYWVLPLDDGGLRALPMPQEYIREMVADWRGAGIAQGHGDDVLPWYRAHKDQMVLHPITRMMVEALIRVPLEERTASFEVEIAFGSLYPTKGKFRKRPVVVEAEQITDRVEIQTLEGVMVGSPGDWLITGVAGEQYPCRDDIFRATYEIVPDCTICAHEGSRPRVCDQHGECLFTIQPDHPFARRPNPEKDMAPGGEEDV